MIQLNPPLPLNTPKGEGLAHFLLDYGPESDLYWTVFITDSGEIWTFANREVRASKNITLGRVNVGRIPAPGQDDGRPGISSVPAGRGAPPALKPADEPSR